METPIFEATGLTKRFGSSFALQDIHMTIQAGDIYGFVGENGAGKTTLMRIIGGLVYPTQGSFSLFGKTEKSEWDAARRQIGFLIEWPALYPHLNAEENLTFYCRIYGIRNPGRIAEVLDTVSLTDTGRNKKVSEYSLGMRQRLGLAIALLNRPKFLVLDEPINGLDPSGIVEVRKILEHLARDKEVTILISSHILSELQLLATKFGFIHRGKLIKEISAQALLKSAETSICIQTPNPSAAAEILKEHLNIEQMTITDNGEIQFPKDNTNLEQLMSVLLEQGVQVEGIHLSAPNLENYYMDLIGGHAS